eukprot:jgi/Botrbrau1/18980/Bobra.0100s0017.1
MLHVTVRRLSELGLYALIGAGLSAVGAISQEDAEAVFNLAAFTTLPSLVLQILSRPGAAGLEALVLSTGALLVSALTGVIAWLRYSARRPPERALLVAAALEKDVASFGYALAEAAFGGIGLFAASLWDVMSRLARAVVTGVIIPSAGTGFPEQYTHADGGVYRGTWAGGRKHGLGSYIYPGGGRYVGEWFSNKKNGRGVYYFPKGGWYEGEWRDGERDGIGVRVLSNGTYKAGFWRGGDLESPLELQQCVLAARAAQRAATAAATVDVREAGWGLALMDLAAQLLCGRL